MDSRALLAGVRQRQLDWQEERLEDAEIDLFDGLMRHRGPVYGTLSEEFGWVDNDTGVASVKLDKEHYLVPWILDHRGRDKRDIHIRFRKQGAQWDGRLDSYKVTRDADGELALELVFKHCFEELKYILIWCSPFTPAALQFPRIWAIIGKLDWCLATTLYVNVYRLESGIWAIPGDPFDPSMWSSFDMSQWSIVVVPVNFLGSSAPVGFIWSRFSNFYDVSKNQLKRSQLSINCRRYYTGDPAPQGLGFTPRNGALVVSFEDHSGWLTGTAFSGSMLTGFQPASIVLDDDGVTENINFIYDDIGLPEEYFQSGWLGTIRSNPWIVLEDDPESGVISSEFEYKPAFGFQHVAGGNAAPMVDELIGVAITSAGNFLGSFIQMPGYGVGLSGLGAAINEVARPLYQGTVLSWMNVPAFGRKSEFGPFGPKEVRSGSDMKAYSLGAFAAVYGSVVTTRERIAHRLTFGDSLVYRLGPNGFGDMWLGTRVGVRPPGTPDDYSLYVDQVREIKYSKNEEGKVEWAAEIGWKEPDDPLLALYEVVKDLAQAMSTLGL